jgi:hypothetical protein
MRLYTNPKFCVPSTHWRAALLPFDIGCAAGRPRHLRQPDIKASATPMKTVLNCAVVAALLIAGGTALCQPIAFTKITQGAIVNDVGQLFVRGVWADFNHDGFLDVFVNDKGGVNVYYTNNGNGTFTKIIQGPEVQGADDHSLPSWVDYNNDGNFDLAVPVGFGGTALSHIQLYSNNGDGTFTRTGAGDLTSQSGHFGLGAWADYDNDGFVDFVVANLPATGSGNNLLFHNNGDGTFTKTSSVPVTSEALAPASLAWVDYDNDGFMDLFAVNSSDLFNRLYHNNRDGTFTRVLTNAIATDQWVGSEQGNAATWGDYDNDGLPDLFIAAGSGAQNRLYHNEGGGMFTKITSGPMLAHAPGVESWGCAWGDYDNDGYVDLFVASYNGSNQLFHNNGDGTFAQVLSGSPTTDGGAGIWYLAPSWVDYDNDGFLDLFVAGASGKNLLYHNNGNTNAWLEVKCAGIASNRAAIGAKVRVLATIGGKTFWQLREMNQGGGHSSLPPVVHFGLGDATNVEALRIEWSSGIVQAMTNVAPRQILSVVEHQQNAAGPISFSGVQRLTNGVAKLSATGNPGLLYVLEASTNLLSWTKLCVRTNLTGTVDFSDTAAPKFTRRFYRVLAP